jgi:hypothetical protein
LPQLTTSYGPIKSGGTIREEIEGTIDVLLTDMPMTDAEMRSLTSWAFRARNGGLEKFSKIRPFPKSKILPAAQLSMLLSRACKRSAAFLHFVPVLSESRFPLADKQYEQLQHDRVHSRSGLRTYWHS